MGNIIVQDTCGRSSTEGLQIPRKGAGPFAGLKSAGGLCALYPNAFVGAIAFVLASAELLVLGVHESHLWSNTGLPWHARLMLVLVSVLTACAVSWPGYWIGLCCAVLGRRIPAAGAIADGALGAAVFFVYAASWVLMWETGMFADADAIVFAVRNAGMLWAYMLQSERAVAAVLIVTSIAAATTAAFASRRWFLLPGAELPPWRLFDGCLVIAFWGSSVSLVTLGYGDAPGPVKQTAEWWTDQRPGRSLTIAYRINPIITAASAKFILAEVPSKADLSPDELGPLRVATPRAEVIGRGRPSSATRRGPFLTGLVMVEIESLRHDLLYLTHEGSEIMPVLNRLARTGLSFRRAYAASTHSNYADPAVLSSLYPLRTTYHHYYSLADPWPKVLIYDAAKQHGCATAVISSQNETWGGMDAFLASKNLDLFFDSRSSDAPKYIAESDTTFARFATEAGMAGKLDDRVTVSRAIEWIESCAKAQRPFVACLNLQTSHFPYLLPKGADKPFQPCELDFPASFVKYPLDKVPVVKNAYYNALHYIDRQLATLVAFLDKSGLRERTLIVIVGDNGECFYENGYSTHAGPPFEPAIHVPLVMNCPGMVAPREEDYLTQAIDVVPTALALMGLPPSPCFQGTNVLAADRLPAERRMALVHNHTLVRATADAIITAVGWKYVFDRKTKSGVLYDLRTDPGERKPLQANYPAAAQTLDRILRRWRDVQLAYYSRPDYYGIYYPPPPPRLSDDDLAALTER